jgi:hypothetical protein
MFMLGIICYHVKKPLPFFPGGNNLKGETEGRKGRMQIGMDIP